MSLLFRSLVFQNSDSVKGDQWEPTYSSCVGEKMRSDRFNVALCSGGELANRFEVLLP